MNLYGKTEASGFADQVAEEVILEILIFTFGRCSTTPILHIDAFKGLFWRIVEMERTEVGNFELDADAAMLFVVFDEAGDEFKIVIKGRWKLLQSFLGQFVSQLLFLQWNVDGQIAIAGDDCLVVEWEEERIDKKDPTKTPWRKIRPKLDPVGYSLFNVQAIDNGIEILEALLFLLELRFLLYQPLQMFGRIVVIWVAKKSFRRCDELWIVGP